MSQDPYTLELSASELHVLYRALCRDLQATMDARLEAWRDVRDGKPTIVAGQDLYAALQEESAAVADLRTRVHDVATVDERLLGRAEQAWDAVLQVSRFRQDERHRALERYVDSLREAAAA